MVNYRRNKLTKVNEKKIVVKVNYYLKLER